jgi:SAM-dependent methyltransferase
MSDPGAPPGHHGPTVLDNQITLSPEDLAQLSALTRQHMLKLFQIDELRTFVMLKRWREFLAKGGKVAALDKEKESNDIVENTLQHNLRQLGTEVAQSRPMGLLGPLLGMDQIAFHRHEAKVLIVGPRSEGEILLYLAHGFSVGNVRGLDLISYSPWIDVGDMHAMPYPDKTFDAVVFSWVLGYSKNQKKAVSEAIRVTKPGGLIAIGEQNEPQDPEEVNAQLKQAYGYTLYGTITRRAQNLIDLFGEAIERVVFQTEPLATERDRIGWISVIVKLKEAPAV